MGKVQLQKRRIESPMHQFMLHPSPLGSCTAARSGKGKWGNRTNTRISEWPPGSWAIWGNGSTYCSSKFPCASFAIEFAADKDVAAQDGTTAVYIAVWTLCCCCSTLELTSMWQKQGATTMHIAAQNGHLEILAECRSTTV